MVVILQREPKSSGKSAILSKFLFIIFLIFPSCWVPVLAATDQLSPKTEVVKSHAETSSAPKISAKELEEIRDALEFQRGMNLEDKIIDRLTKRFTWIGILVAVIGLFGITAITNLLVAPIINRTRDAASKANAEVEVASRTIAEMRSAAMRAKEDADAVLKQANEQREIVSKITNELSQKAADLDKRFDSIQANAENIRDQLEQSFTALDERLTRLATEVPRALDEQKALREASGAKLDEFKRNSEYTIQFSVFGNTDVPELPNLMEHL